jgi:hypothetical protein
MMAAVLEEGQRLSSTQDGWQDQVRKAFDALLFGFTER